MPKVMIAVTSRETGFLRMDGEGDGFSFVADEKDAADCATEEDAQVYAGILVPGNETLVV